MDLNKYDSMPFKVELLPTYLMYSFSVTEFLSDPSLSHLTHTGIDETEQLSEPGPGREKSTGEAPPG